MYRLYEKDNIFQFEKRGGGVEKLEIDAEKMIRYTTDTAHEKLRLETDGAEKQKREMKTERMKLAAERLGLGNEDKSKQREYELRIGELEMRGRA